MKAIRITLLFLLTAVSFQAQESLDLEDAIRSMKENNTRLKIQQYEIDLSKSELSGTLSGFLPGLSVSHTGFYTNDPLNVFGFKLQQRIVSEMDFNPLTLNNPKGFQHFNTKFSLQQPLLNFDVFAARKALKNKIEAMGYQKQYAEAMLTVEVKNTYTNLQFLYEAKNALNKAVLAYEEVLRNTLNLEKQGYAKHSDVLMVRVGLSEVESQLIEVENNISNLSNYMSWLMGTDRSVVYIPSDPLEQTLVSSELPSFSEDRADIRAMKSGVAAREKMISVQNRALLPRLNAFGEFNYQDKNIFGTGADSYMAGVSLSWDVFDGNKTLNKIKHEKINKEKAEVELQLHLEKSRLELQQKKRELTAVQAKIGLASTAREQAAESLRILENRYGQGLEKTSDLLVSQATELEKQVSYLEVVKDYNMLIIQIEFLTHTIN